MSQIRFLIDEDTPHAIDIEAIETELMALKEFGITVITRYTVSDNLRTIFSIVNHK